ncbi:hypothetical protein [Novosphingobium gossypii]|uniref:hypothetical protein n=1 Tax=Novosphingobium gossypii TaxID=1604774 RepID=UPI003D19EDB3
MTGGELIALAEWCEAAAGADRELDAAVFRSIGAPVPFQFANKLLALTFDEARNAYFADIGEMRVRYEPPAFTASVDAAMTLVPEGCLHMARTIWDAAGKTAGIGRVDRYVSGKWTDGFDSCAASPALALTAAALRALASMKDAA